MKSFQVNCLCLKYVICVVSQNAHHVSNFCSLRYKKINKMEFIFICYRCIFFILKWFEHEIKNSKSNPQELKWAIFYLHRPFRLLLRPPLSLKIFLKKAAGPKISFGGWVKKYLGSKLGQPLYYCRPWVCLGQARPIYRFICYRSRNSHLINITTRI